MKSILDKEEPRVNMCRRSVCARNRKIQNGRWKPTVFLIKTSDKKPQTHTDTSHLTTLVSRFLRTLENVKSWNQLDSLKFLASYDFLPPPPYSSEKPISDCFSRTGLETSLSHVGRSCLTSCKGLKSLQEEREVALNRGL